MPKVKKAIGDALQAFGQTYVGAAREAREEKRYQSEREEEERWKRFYSELATRQDARAEQGFELQKAGAAREEESYKRELAAEYRMLEAYQKQTGMSPEMFAVMGEKEKSDWARQEHALNQQLVQRRMRQVEVELGIAQKESQRADEKWGLEKQGLSDENRMRKVQADVAERTKTSTVLDAFTDSQTKGLQLEVARGQLEEAKRNAKTADERGALDALAKDLEFAQGELARAGQALEGMYGSTGEVLPGAGAAEPKAREAMERAVENVNAVGKRYQAVLGKTLGVDWEAERAAEGPALLPENEDDPATRGLRLTDVGRQVLKSSSSKKGVKAKAYNWVMRDSQTGELVQMGSDDQAEYVAAGKHPEFAGVFTNTELVDPEGYGKPWKRPKGWGSKVLDAVTPGKSGVNLGAFDMFLRPGGMGF